MPLAAFLRRGRIQTIDGVCPYNSAYGLGCKCVSNLVSCPAGQVGVGESCDEMYASCECDPALVACSAKENGTGAECDGQYTDCVCPAGVDEGPYGCAEYYPSPCSSVCKTSKSDNCDNRTEVSTPYGCESYYGDCSSKCQTCYADNCRNRTAVSVPANAHCTSYYSDCSSKCSAWSCDSGYNQSGASCVQEKTCEDYGYESPGLFPINWDCSPVTVSGLKCYRCVKGPVCPSDTATYCKKLGYGHVRCKVGTVSSQTQEPCPCNSGYWKCVSSGGSTGFDRCGGGRPGSSCACGGTHSGVGFAAAHFCVEQIK